jgi:hypothetical protein
VFKFEFRQTSSSFSNLKNSKVYQILQTQKIQISLNLQIAQNFTIFLQTKKSRVFRKVYALQRTQQTRILLDSCILSFWTIWDWVRSCACWTGLMGLVFWSWKFKCYAVEPRYSATEGTVKFTQKSRFVLYWGQLWSFSCWRDQKFFA